MVTITSFQAKKSWKSYSWRPYPRSLHSAQHTAQGSARDHPVLHCVVLPHPLGALLNMNLPSNLIDMIIQAENPLETNSSESNQLACCHPEYKFGRGNLILHQCLENREQQPKAASAV